MSCRMASASIATAMSSDSASYVDMASPLSGANRPVFRSVGELPVKLSRLPLAYYTNGRRASIIKFDSQRRRSLFHVSAVLLFLYVRIG
jgi:hypothetical protein